MVDEGMWALLLADLSGRGFCSGSKTRKGGPMDRAIVAGVPFSWVTADEAHGQVTYLRVWLEGVSASLCKRFVGSEGRGWTAW
jgi:hypothetical protein